MAEAITAKAPGKILWIGGYSVLERPNISFVTTVNAYVTSSVTKNQDDKVEFNSPQLGRSASCTMDKISGAISGDVPKELLLFKTAAEITTKYLCGLGVRTSGMNITATNDNQFSYSISSDKIVKSGLGSSAAVTVATVASVLKAYDFELSPDLIHKLSQIAHSIATGKIGSGFDIAASAYGSIIYTRFSPGLLALPEGFTGLDVVGLVKKEWDCTITKSPLLEDFHLAFANFVGESMSTIKAVGSVSDYKKKDPDGYGRLIREINDCNVTAVQALKEINMGETDNMGVFRNAFDRGRALTKKLGVASEVDIEPDDCTSLIEESKHNGAFVAKLPGAGGKDAITALATGERDNKRLKDFWSTHKELSVMDLKIENNGVIA